MMKKNILITLLVAGVSAIPIVYLAAIYNALPAIVPTHFGLDGRPNGFGSKELVLLAVLILAALPVGIYLLLVNLNQIDPKKTAKLAPQTFQRIAMGVVLLFTALNLSVIYATQHQAFSIRILLPLLGLFFVFMGNMMHSIKPNYFVGIRLPWTLEDPDNWRSTHQLGGKLWFAGGIIITVTTLALPQHLAIVCFFGCVACMVICPIIYSYSYFKNHQA